MPTKWSQPRGPIDGPPANTEADAETRGRTGDLQIFSLTLSQLSYRGFCWRAGRKQINLLDVAFWGCPWGCSGN